MIIRFPLIPSFKHWARIWFTIGIQPGILVYESQSAHAASILMDSQVNTPNKLEETVIAHCYCCDEFNGNGVGWLHSRLKTTPYHNREVRVRRIVQMWTIFRAADHYVNLSKEGNSDLKRKLH